MTRRSRHALLALLLVTGPVAAAVDPFYRARMESGVRAFDRGNWEQADHQLRIACFGHLDEPIALAGGLMRLAVVRATLDDEDGFRRIFSRLIELEERFSAYGGAPVPADLRQRFESLAARLVPEETLRSNASFQSIADRAVIQRLAAMSPERRRADLEARIEAEPYRADWLLEMARLEIEARRPSLALDWLDRLPGDTATTPTAICLRQQAASEGESCGRMDLSRPFCASVPASVVEFRLACLVEAERWPEASALLAEMPATSRSKRRVVRLERKIGRAVAKAEKSASAAVPTGSAEATAAGPTGEPAATAAPGDEVTLAETADTPPSAAPAAPRPSTEQRPQREPALGRQLAQLRTRLATASTTEQIVELMSEAVSLAADHPESRQAQLLAAELAYLQSDWTTTIHYFRRAGQLRPDEAHLVFYQAVALYETGEPAAAADLLRPVASRLQRTSFVGAYVDRILGGAGNRDGVARPPGT